MLSVLWDTICDLKICLTTREPINSLNMKNSFTINCVVLATTANTSDIQKAFTDFCAQNNLEIVENEYQTSVFTRNNLLPGDVIWEIWEHQGEDGPGIVDIVRSEEELESTLQMLSYSSSKKRWSRRIEVTEKYIKEMSE